MKIKDVVHELIEIAQDNKNYVSRIVAREALDYKIFDEANFENEITETEIETLINNMIYYFEHDITYNVDDMLVEAMRYNDDFDSILYHSDNPYLDDYRITDLTNTICDLYIMTFKIEINNILGYILQQIIDEDNKK